MPKLRAVIFDIGRVLIRLDIQRVKSALAQGLPLSPGELWSAIEKDPRWPDWQEGRMSPRDWHLHLCKRFNLSLDFEQFKTVWNSALDPEPIHKSSYSPVSQKTIASDCSPTPIRYTWKSSNQPTISSPIFQ